MKDRKHVISQDAQASSSSGADRHEEFSELVTENRPHRTSTLFKLTDECSAALHEALEKKLRVRMHYAKDSCVLEVGNGEGTPGFRRFNCVVQPVGHSGPIDAIAFDKTKRRFDTISSLGTKIQVKATDKTFEETREKTQKLLKEQQKRRTMDMTQNVKHTSRQRPFAPAPFKKQGSSSNLLANQKPKSAHAISIKPSNAIVPGSATNAKSSAARPVESSLPPSALREIKTPALKPASPKPKVDSLKPVSDSAFSSASNGSPVSNATILPSFKNYSAPTQFKKRYFTEDPASANNMIARKKRNETGSSASSSGASSTEVSPTMYSQMLATKAGKQTDVFPDRLTNGNLMIPMKPSQDWPNVYREIENFNDAKKYHDIFKAEYPEYYECYKALSSVANEFMDLERLLKSTQVGTLDHNKMEEAIQSKFAKYQQDVEFLKRRQRHADLRSKLEVLKRRISNWENCRENSSDKAKGAERDIMSLSDMMVM
ncbi:occludin homology domain-containing protein [Ditylenchus destructor]|nr:occludin homology domain-containing protein [Ditylenchus destructor]